MDEDVGVVEPEQHGTEGNRTSENALGGDNSGVEVEKKKRRVIAKALRWSRKKSKGASIVRQPNCES